MIDSVLNILVAIILLNCSFVLSDKNVLFQMFRNVDSETFCKHIIGQVLANDTIYLAARLGLVKNRHFANEGYWQNGNFLLS